MVGFEFLAIDTLTGHKDKMWVGFHMGTGQVWLDGGKFGGRVGPFFWLNFGSEKPDKPLLTEVP